MAGEEGTPSSFWEHFPEVAHKIVPLAAAARIASECRRQGKGGVTLCPLRRGLILVTG